jgi:hypothetical protein
VQAEPPRQTGALWLNGSPGQTGAPKQPDSTEQAGHIRQTGEPEPAGITDTSQLNQMVNNSAIPPPLARERTLGRTATTLSSRIPLPQLRYTELGIGVTDAGFAAEYRTKNDATLWDIMHTALRQDSYVKLFASHLFRKFPEMAAETRQEWMSEIVEGLGRRYNDPGS